MKVALLSLLTAVICSCSLNQSSESGQEKYGFIGDYSKFEKIETKDGLEALRYTSDKIKSGIYHKVIIDAVAFYPEQKTSNQVTPALLAQIKDYLDKGFAAAIAESFEIVDTPQSAAFRLTPRITAVKTTAGDINLRELIPIGTVVALGKAVLGQRHENTEVFLEVKATDSLSGEFIGGSVKQGKGMEVGDSNEVVTMEHIKIVLDTWIGDTREIFATMRVLADNG